MAIRIAGVNIPENKNIEVALTYIFGIGPSKGKEIAKLAGLTLGTKAKDLPEDAVIKLRDIVEKQFVVEGDLRREVALNINRLKEIGAYRGVRHSRNLPVRGQRTKTNARTKRGKKVTMGSGRRKLEKT